MEVLERVRPCDVGISANAVKELFESLDCGATEPHGLLLTRHGKIFAEGYWKPYSAGLVHGMQSLSKTYAGTAIGIAVQKNLLSLNDVVLDFFPEYMELAILPYIKELKVHHLLSMSTGMRKMSGFEGDWIYNFFTNPIVDRPGTKFFYNSVGSTLLGEIIRRVSKDTLNEFLEKNLYDKIGINKQGIRWLCLPDGMEIGGSGLYSTLINNTLLGLLYMNQGKWNGEQILDKEFCQLASTKQIDNWITEGIVKEGEAGYGYQIWMGMHKNTYCMCGAMGQYTIMCPDEDIVISFSGRTADAVMATSETVLEKCWKFLESISLEKNAQNFEKENQDLEKYLERLSLPGNPCFPFGDISFFEGSWKIIDGEFDLDMTTGGIMRTCFTVHPIESYDLSFHDDTVCIRYNNDSGDHILQAGLDGIPRLNEIVTEPFPCSKVLASAAFQGKNLTIYLRWIETCYSAKLIFESNQENICIKKIYDAVDPEGSVIIHKAGAVKIQ